MQLIVSYSPGVYVSFNARSTKAVGLLYELCKCESELQDWIGRSEANARWFAWDPIGAIRAAKLGLSEETLAELESVTVRIAQKLSECAGAVSN